MEVESLVIGAGVVGLACAAELARRGDEVLVVERHDGWGRETSSRNSGVVHAGVYYPAGSLKARACVEGRELLYARCRRDGVAHRVCGKLIVAASDAELPALERLRENAQANGVSLAMIDGADVARREPAVRAVAGLVSPRTGIVDAHGLAGSYAAEARRHGADLVYRTTVVGLAPRAGGWLVETTNADGERADVRAARVINAAGLAADRLAALAGADAPTHRFCKGDYFALGRVRTHGLVYPLPSNAGLGVHVTVDLAGQLRAGPDTEWVDVPRYDVDPKKARAFGEALRRYLPDVRDEDLTPDYAGVRPKLHGPGEPKPDFLVDARDPSLVHLLGIESPGLTASEALARHVARLSPRS